MVNKKRLIYIVIAFCVLLIGSFIGYKYLSKNYENSKEGKQFVESGFTEKAPEEKVEKAPNFIAYNKDGKEVKLSDFKGKKAVVVNFWASWCPPCKAEMPYFNEASKKYKNDNVEILMVNLTDGMRETKDKALEYVKKEDYNMNILFDEKLNGAEAYNVQALPRTLFIDKDGNIQNDHTGLITQEILNDNIETIIS